MKKRLLTGIRTTGPLHIGHYFGAVQNIIKYQNEHETFVMGADIQALTDNWENPKKVTENVYQVFADLLACGVNPDVSNIFLQSQISEIAELTVLFSNLITVNKLSRNPTIKTEIAQKSSLFGQNGESITFGFLGYPVSQAADILSVMAEIVPVGQDQIPVLEITRDIVSKFNNIYGQTFKMPEIILASGAGSKIIGLDGNSKMSKSLGNCVYLSDSPQTTIDKFKAAKTDSFSEIIFDPESRPEISNLISLYSLVNGIDNSQSENDLKNVKYGAFKEKLGHDFNKYFSDIRLKREILINDKNQITEIIRRGNQKAKFTASEVMEKVKSRLGINYL